MRSLENYLLFEKENGRSLSEINPGSKEFALIPELAFVALEMLLEIGTPIVGGDILSIDLSGNLIYAYQHWGSKYHVLNWYCDQVGNESRRSFLERSNQVAKDAIAKAVQVSSELNQDCLIVFIF